MKFLSIDKTCCFSIDFNENKELVFSYEDVRLNYFKSWIVAEADKLQKCVSLFSIDSNSHIKKEAKRNNFKLIKDTPKEISFEAVFYKEETSEEKIIRVTKNFNNKKWFIYIWTDGKGRLAQAPRSTARDLSSRIKIWDIAQDLRDKILSEGFDEICF